MDSAEAFPQRVYTGVWTNWSRGKMMGSTLTLTRTDANVFIAFLAFFVTLGKSLLCLYSSCQSVLAA